MAAEDNGFTIDMLAEEEELEEESEDAIRDSVVGDYMMGGMLGRGAFGRVFKGLSMKNSQFVAIKELRFGSGPNLLPEEELPQVMGEIQLLRNLSHPNIVQYLESQKKDQALYIVLEYIENGSLKDILTRFGCFPEHLAAVYAHQLLLALVYLGKMGVIHRDIKAANILITRDGTCKLADFGVAITQRKVEETEDFEVGGTPFWMAPEIFEGDPPTTASDIWSLGCTVIELITGNPPYHDLTAMNAVYHIMEDDQIPLPDDASPECLSFLRSCLAKDPEQRRSAKDLLMHPWISAHCLTAEVKRRRPNYERVTSAVKQHRRKSLSEDDHNALKKASGSMSSDVVASLLFHDQREKPDPDRAASCPPFDAGELSPIKAQLSAASSPEAALPSAEAKNDTISKLINNAVAGTRADSSGSWISEFTVSKTATSKKRDSAGSDTSKGSWLPNQLMALLREARDAREGKGKDWATTCGDIEELREAYISLLGENSMLQKCMTSSAREVEAMRAIRAKQAEEVERFQKERQLLSERITMLEDSFVDMASDTKLARSIFGRNLAMDQFPSAVRGVLFFRRDVGLFPDKAWHKRYCLLQDNFLFLYKPKDRSEPVDVFRLLQPQITPVDEVTCGRKFGFRVQCIGSGGAHPMVSSTSSTSLSSLPPSASSSSVAASSHSNRRWFWLCAQNTRTMAKWMMAFVDSPQWYQNTELDREEFKKRFTASSEPTEERTTIPVQVSAPSVCQAVVSPRRHTLAVPLVSSQSEHGADTGAANGLPSPGARVGSQSAFEIRERRRSGPGVEEGSSAKPKKGHARKLSVGSSGDREAASDVEESPRKKRAWTSLTRKKTDSDEYQPSANPMARVASDGKTKKRSSAKYLDAGLRMMKSPASWGRRRKSKGGQADSSEMVNVGDSGSGEGEEEAEEESDPRASEGDVSRDSSKGNSTEEEDEKDGLQ